MFIKYDENYNVFYQTKVTNGLPEDFKQGLIEVDIPSPPYVIGKEPIMKYNPSDNTVYYDYADRDLTDKEMISQLKSTIDQQNQQLQEQAGAIAELTTLIATTSV